MLQDVCVDLQPGEVDAKSEPVCRFGLKNFIENSGLYNGLRLTQILIPSSRRISNMFDILSRF